MERVGCDDEVVGVTDATVVEPGCYRHVVVSGLYVEVCLVCVDEPDSANVSVANSPPERVVSADVYERSFQKSV